MGDRGPPAGLEGGEPTSSRPAALRRRRTYLTLVVAALLLMSGALIPLPGTSHINGIDGRAGRGCGGLECHQRVDPTLAVRIVGVPHRYESSTTYPLIIRLSNGTAPNPNEGAARGGFDLSVSAGVLSATDFDPQVRLYPGVDGKVREAGHSAATNGQREWRLNWTSPSGGKVIFLLSVNAVNGDGTPEGDGWTGQTFEVLGPEGTNDIDVVPIWALIGVVLTITIIGYVVGPRRRKAAKTAPSSSPSKGRHYRSLADVTDDSQE